MRSVFVICLYWYLTLVVPTEGNTFRFDYTYNHELNGWFKYHVRPATFTSAFMRCHAEGAVLASPVNQKLLLAMVELHEFNAYAQRGVFTGIHAIFSKTDYASVEGVPLDTLSSVVYWAPFEPDNYKNSEDCTILLSNGTLADVQCNNVFPYICFRKESVEKVNEPCGTVDMEYELDSRTGSCYKFHRLGRNWRQAYMTCMAEGGYLTVINGATEAQVIKELFAKNPANTIETSYKDTAAIGLYDMGGQTWFSIHGQTLPEAGFPAFDEGQPDGNGLALCGGIFRNGLLDDLSCSMVLPFICEKKPDSLRL